MDADAWATALMVLGAVKGKTLALKQGLDALFIQRTGEELVQIAVGPVFGLAHEDRVETDRSAIKHAGRGGA